MRQKVTKRAASAAASARAMQAVPYFAQKMGVFEIAERMGVDVATVKRWVKRPEVAAALERIGEAVVDETKGEVTSIVKDALRGLHELLGAEDEHVRMKAIDSALDRFGHPKRSESKIEQVTPPMSVEEARARLEVLRSKLEGGES